MLPHPIMQRLLDMLRPDSVHIMQASSCTLSSTLPLQPATACACEAILCGDCTLERIASLRSVINNSGLPLWMYVRAGRAHRAQRRHGAG